MVDILDVLEKQKSSCTFIAQNLDHEESRLD